MKKKLLQTGLIFLLILITVGVFGHSAFAQATTAGGGATAPATTATAGAVAKSGESPAVVGAVTSLWGLNFDAFASTVVATVANWAINGMGYVLLLSGWLLNFSINLTLHIKDFVSSTPAIYTTWRAIRDLSGIFIIFMLLWAALQLILNLKSSSFGNLIKNVIVVGLLINFSFFFAGLGIDASNIVSVQLYNAIAPANSLNAGSATGNLSASSFSSLDGGLSDIFMGSLKIQSIYKTGLALSAKGGPQPAYVIFFGGITAVMIELGAALSFAAAAAAFILRFVILLLLLAFSPLWIAAHVIPQLKKYSSQWTEQYVAMLTFMPVYLLLMYLAINMLVSNPDGLFGGIVAGGSGPWYSNLLILGVNAFLVCFLLNMPLVVAAKMGGAATSFISTKTIGMDALWKKFSSNVGSRTLGRAAYAVNDSRAVRSLNATVPILGSAVSSGLGSVSKAGFGGKKGYDARLKDKKKAEEATHKYLSTIDKSRFDNNPNNKKEYTYKDAEGKEKTEELTELGYQEALSKVDQKSYRQNLPWRNMFTGKPGGVIGFLVDNRANRQTSAKLTAEAGKKEKKGQKKTFASELESSKAELAKIEAEITAQAKPTGFQPGKPATAEQLAKIEELKKTIAEKQKNLDEIAEIEDDEKTDKLAKKVAEESKSEGGGGGGGGGDKPKEKEGGDAH